MILFISSQRQRKISWLKTWLLAQKQEYLVVKVVDLLPAIQLVAWKLTEVKFFTYSFAPTLVWHFEINRSSYPSIVNGRYPLGLSLLKLKLAGLPERAVIEELLDAIAQPFLVKFKRVPSTVIRKNWNDVILPSSFTFSVVAVVGWTVKCEKVYTERRWMATTLRGGDL